MVDRPPDNATPEGADDPTHGEGAYAHAQFPHVEQADVRLRSRKSPGKSSRSRLGRVIRWTALGCAALALLILAGAGAFWLALSNGPISANALGSRIAANLEQRLGEGYSVDIGRASLENADHGPEVSVADLQVKGRSGEVVFEAPHATVSIDTMALFTGQVRPRRLEAHGVELRLVVRPDGSVALSAGKEALVVSDAGAASATIVPPAAEPAQDGASAQVAPAIEDAAMRPVMGALRRLLALAVGGGSPLSSLESFALTRGQLVFADLTTGRSTRYDGLEIFLDRKEGVATLAISAAGPSGRWRVTARARGEAATGEGLARSLDIDVSDISAVELSLLAGWRDPPVDFDTPLSARLSLGLGADGGLENASGRFTAGAGFFFIKDPDHEPLPINEVSGGFRWDVAARRFEVLPTQFNSGRTRLSFSGLLTPPEAPEGAWALTLESGAGAFGSERPGEDDIPVARTLIEARLSPLEKSFTIDRFSLEGPELSFALSGEGSMIAGARRLSLRAESANTSARTIMRLWPTPIAAQVRAYLLAHVLGGRLTSGAMGVDLDEAAFIAISQQSPVAVGAVRIEYELADMQMSYLDGAPPLAGVSGAGIVTGRTARFTAREGYLDLGPRGRLAMSEGRFEAPDFARKPAPASIALRVSGSMEAVSELLSRDALKAFGGVPLEPGLAKGQIDARLNIDLRLSKDSGKDTVLVRANAQATNLSIEKFAGKERFEQGSLTIVADEAGVRASGQGRLFGAPARVELKKPADGLGEAILTLTLDDAARAKQGWSAPGLNGPVSARVTSPFGGGDKSRPQVEIDFTKAAMAAFPPGYSKPAGRAAKASFTLVFEGDKTILQSFSFDGGAASAQGVIELDASGALASARMSQLRMSPGDDMKLDAQSGKDGLKLVVRGGSVDARPFVQDLAGGGGAEDAPAKDFDLDLKVSLLNGHNGQSISGVEVRVVRRGGTLRDFRIAGRSGRSAITGAMLNTPAGQPPQFYVRSADGGALLSFLDLYRRMEGGQLQLVGLNAGPRMSGVLSIRDFVLRNEPALRRLVAEGGARFDERSGLDANAVQFSRLQAAFARTPGRLELREGAINGPAIGATIEGALDFSRDQVALSGTFVPAYGVNNLFAKIPLFGPILGGGSNEGLIGVNFRISGSASAPLLTINPLSAIAPGFLRKIFEAPDAIQPNLPVDPSTPAPPLAPAPAPAAPARPSMPMSITPGR